jgi:LuxR family maltose regulon positive regulatory protein
MPVTRARADPSPRKKKAVQSHVHPLRTGALGRLAAPRLGRVFDRERLFIALDEMTSAPGVWIAAPPGAGKTTLAATWLRRQHAPVFWLQLDPADADAAALAHSLDQTWGESMPEVELPPLRVDDLDDLPRWLRLRLRYLLPRLPAQWTLVLDNMQELPTGSLMQGALAEALAELPAGVQWLFVSRDSPPPPFTGALARQHLRVLDAESLRFDGAETHALIGLHGKDAAVFESLAPAQGWAAGLTLMLIGRPLARHLTALDAQERLFDYFASEVLERMPATDQAALTQLAYLPGTTAELAVALTGQPAVPDLLERLAAQSLFTQRREAPSPLYDFHALFGSFLRRHHERIAAPETVLELKLRAARLLLASADTDAGLALLLEAQAWDEAEAQVRRHAAAFIIEGRAYALARHIAALPAAAGERLAYWRGLCALDAQPATALTDMARALALPGDAQAQLATAAVAATALIMLGRVKALDPWIDVLDRHAGWFELPATPEADLFVVPGLLSALVVRRPWHALAPLLAQRTERVLDHHGAVGQRLLLGNLTFYLQWRGDM